MSNPSMARFLRYRFAAFTGWAVLVAGTWAATVALTESVHAQPVRMLVVWGAVGLAVLVGLPLQRWMLRRADPDGALRAELRRSAG